MSPVDKYLDARESAIIAESFRNAGKRLILLDYDGTLVPFNCDPAKALPDPFLLQLLHDLSNTENLDLVIISGRHKDFLEGIFHDLQASVFAEHGAIYRIDGKWDSLENDISWKDEISEIMQESVNSTPGSNLEKKENSLVWHYRSSDNDLADKKAAELITRLTPSCNKSNLIIMKGRKIIEVKLSEYTKGTAIMNFFDCNQYDFILAAGDDITDEDLFEALPGRAIKIHVGKFSDISDYTITNSYDLVNFLKSLIK